MHLSLTILAFWLAGPPLAAVSVSTLAWALPAALLAVLLVRSLIEPTWLDVVQVPMKVGAARPFKVLLLGDLHAECLRLDPDKLLRACAAARPDLVLFCGDLAAKVPAVPAALALLARIRTLPDLAGCPFLAARGNHDSLANFAALAPIGVTPLLNQALPLELGGETWAVVGLDDLRTGRPDAAEALRQAERLQVPASRRIVVAHNPDILLGWPDGKAALFACGHLHGGQIWLPFRLEFFLLRRDKLPRLGHVRGLFGWRGMPVYISRGLGCVLLPMRLFSRPEITILNFQ